jgi:class 3 adenylate cyclase/tetratricopeptide (TPR) repeat protein
MRCPNCQCDNPEGAKFCAECGNNLTATSKATPQVLSFNEKLEKIQRSLPGGLTEKILSQRDKIEGERRHVTVMFCDMEGFTPLVERLGPEEAYSIMDQVYEILIHKVYELEGIVNEMTGDGIMALFGAPIALEDAPQRALWSALSIHQEIAEFNDKRKPRMPVRMRIGIHTGPVVVGTLGNDLRIELKAVGDTVNLASRMEGLAEAGTTYVTEEIFRQTEGLFQFESIGKKDIKGKDEAISVYQVISGKEDLYRPRLGSERMIYSDMVGRERELDRLELQVMKAINGEGSVINIIGEAGIGKSRLVAELRKRDVIKRVNLLEGRAISTGRNLSFHPFIDVFKQWARIREDDGEAVALGKLEASVRNVCSEEVYEVLPFVATLMGMKLPNRYAERIKSIEGEALEQLILKSVRELLIKATELTPQVIIIEDLHWIDTSSLELMLSLFRLVETQKILFINVFRPGHTETGERIVVNLKEKLAAYYVEILLEPLDERISEALIHNMLNIKGLHHNITKQVVQRASGNPFFIEEIVRSFIDEGVVVLKQGSFELTEKIGQIDIPHTINDLLMARIDRLEDRARNLLKIASVIGRNFFYKILVEVANLIEDIDNRLSYLKNMQFILERRRMDELEYLFKHALAQKAAYESILSHRRKELHLRVAESIEKVFGDKLHEFYGMLAYHYGRAEDLEKTEEFLIKAGEEALRSAASDEALHYYEEALQLYRKKSGDDPDPEKVAMLEKNIALALYNKGRFEEAIIYFDKALEYYWGPLPKNAVSALLKVLSASLNLLISLYLPSLKHKRIPTQKDAEVVELSYKKCLSLAIKDPMRYFFELMYAYKEVSKFDLSRFDLGLEIFLGVSGLFTFSGISFKLSRKILDSAKHKVQESDPKRSIVYEYLELILIFLEGNWKKIGDWVDDLANKNLRIGEIYSAVQYLYWYGLLNIYRGSSDVAKSMVKELNEIVEVYDNDFAQILKYELNTALLMEYRKLNDALSEVKQGIDFAQKAGLGIFLLDLLSYEVWIHILMGDIEKAGKSLQRANEIKPKEHAAPVELLDLCRSQLEYDLYRLQEAIRNGNQSESIEFRKSAAKSSRMLLKVSRKGAPHRTEAYKLRGVYYWLINKQKKALKWWHKAIEEGERLGARVELSRACFEIGKRLLEPKSKYEMLDGIRADDYLQRARVLFEEMDLQWDLDELSRVSRD